MSVLMCTFHGQLLNRVGIRCIAIAPVTLSSLLCACQDPLLCWASGYIALLNPVLNWTLALVKWCIALNIVVCIVVLTCNVLLNPAVKCWWSIASCYWISGRPLDKWRQVDSSCVCANHVVCRWFSFVILQTMSFAGGLVLLSCKPCRLQVV